jgi:hypothetical protein
MGEPGRSGRLALDDPSRSGHRVRAIVAPKYAQATHGTTASRRSAGTKSTFHGPARPKPLVRSLQRHLRALNRSERTIATYLISLRQADAFLRAHGTTLEAATRADLEAFMADVLARGRAPNTAAPR